jgi:hypothetical protein
VADEYQNVIYKISTSNPKSNMTGISVCANPSEVVASPSNFNIAYVLCAGEPEFQIINITSNQIAATITLPEPASSMTVTSDGQYAFVT